MWFYYAYRTGPVHCTRVLLWAFIWSPLQNCGSCLQGEYLKNLLVSWQVLPEQSITSFLFQKFPCCCSILSQFRLLWIFAAVAVRSSSVHHGLWVCWSRFNSVNSHHRQGFYIFHHGCWASTNPHTGLILKTLSVGITWMKSAVCSAWHFRVLSVHMLLPMILVQNQIIYIIIGKVHTLVQRASVEV